MRGRELYARYHRLIYELARTARPGTDWRAELAGHVEKLETDAKALGVGSARQLCEELCAQFEHEALSYKNPLARQILFAAVKRLELLYANGGNSGEATIPD